MSLDDLIDAFDRAIFEIQATRESRAVVSVNDALALLKRRIIESQELSDGTSTGRYSTNEVPVYYYYNQTRRKGSAYDELVDGVKSGSIGRIEQRTSQRTGKTYKALLASYADWRDVNNLPSNNKTYSFTGRMWQNVSTSVLLISPERLVVGIDARSTEEAEKLESILEKEPTILDLSESENDLIDDMNIDRINTILLNTLGFSI